jgi:hypothetical protein
MVAGVNDQAKERVFDYKLGTLQNLDEIFAVS